MTRTRLPTEAFLITFDTGDGSALRRPRGSDGYPPYDIERLPPQKGVERLRVTLAVAQRLYGGLDDVVGVLVEQLKKIALTGQQFSEDHGFFSRVIKMTCAWGNAGFYPG